MTYYINGEKVTKEEFFEGSKGINYNEAHNIMTSSFKEFISPIDGSKIASSRQLRDHEKRYNVRQVGNDLLTKK